MKRVEERPSRPLLALYRALMAVLVLVVVIILAGTVYGLAKKKRGTAEAPGTEISPSGETAGGDSIFSGIGALRITTADPEPETLVISLAFPYDKNDRPFAEELASRISYFKSATAEYLGAFTTEELNALDEDTISRELLSRYNSALHLGQIRDLYILEYMRL
ncbi:MAG: flagellar basal body protein FliL [Treponema sp.]|jgi:flagellar basal body-associated protein FliL|nr:flagellar basal body protein FliL [Treponema sp.]